MPCYTWQLCLSSFRWIYFCLNVQAIFLTPEPTWQKLSVSSSQSHCLPRLFWSSPVLPNHPIHSPPVRFGSGWIPPGARRSGQPPSGWSQGGLLVMARQACHSAAPALRLPLPLPQQPVPRASPQFLRITRAHGREGGGRSMRYWRCCCRWGTIRLPSSLACGTASLNLFRMPSSTYGSESHSISFLFKHLFMIIFR